MKAIGVLAGATSPYIKLMSKAGAMLIMASMAFVAAGHVGCLRETKG
jgi:hypothetical protein